MTFLKKNGLLIAGLCAGIVNGLFGAGGGMILVPLLTALTTINRDQVFPYSVSIILPVCIVSLFFSQSSIGLYDLWPYLIGSAAGGVLCGMFGQRIPTIWLHRFLGLMILWGGVRYLC